MELSNDKESEIIRAYKGIGKSIFQHKEEVMNRLSEYFSEDTMRYVYAVILQYEKGKTK